MKKVYLFLKIFGFDISVFLSTLAGVSFYTRDFLKIRKQKNIDQTFVFGNCYPILNERFSTSGIMSGHYFHQDLLVAQKIFKNNPRRHIDIGSRTDGFVAHVAVFREIEVVDIRPQVSKINNISFTQMDLMWLPEKFINSYDSISSLHAIEHFGLGRYGDKIDYFGYLKALQNIYTILEVGGKFYFSVPIGRQRIEFNAHRVFSLAYLISLFQDKYKIESFSYVNDQGELVENAALEENNINTNFDCHYGCGIFELTKL